MNLSREQFRIGRVFGLVGRVSDIFGRWGSLVVVFWHALAQSCVQRPHPFQF